MDSQCDLSIFRCSYQAARSLPAQVALRLGFTLVCPLREDLEYYSPSCIIRHGPPKHPHAGASGGRCPLCFERCAHLMNHCTYAAQRRRPERRGKELFSLIVAIVRLLRRVKCVLNTAIVSCSSVVSAGVSAEAVIPAPDAAGDPLEQLSLIHI